LSRLIHGLVSFNQIEVVSFYDRKIFGVIEAVIGITDVPAMTVDGNVAMNDLVGSVLA